MSYVRAVAYMADGNSTEDVVLINAPDYGEEVDVDFVELFTTVVDRKGKAVEGLTEKDFTVLEDGVQQQVRRFELVRDLPIYAGIMIDTSASMGERGGERLDEAIKAATPLLRDRHPAQGPGRGDHLQRHADPGRALHQPDGRADRRPAGPDAPRGTRRSTTA